MWNIILLLSCLSIGGECTIFVSYFFKEWKASHSNLCAKTPFHPLFSQKIGEEEISGTVKTDASLPNVADTRQNDWKSANVMPVRYCSAYPNLRLQPDTSGNDWLHSDADVSDMETQPPPSYEEAMQQQDDAFVDVDFMTPTDIPLTDFSSEIYI